MKTKAEVTAKIEAILAAHPYLADVEERCCYVCTTDDVRDEFGREAAVAWDNLGDYRWLAG